MFKRIDICNAFYKQTTLINHHIDSIEQIVKNTFHEMEGNCVYNHLSFQRNPSFLSKQLNLFSIGMIPYCRKVCEVGFNAGHSSLFMILGHLSKETNAKMELLLFDIDKYPYTAPCLEYIENTFQQTATITYIKGESSITIPQWIQKNPKEKHSFDAVHIDGSHTEYDAFSDMENANTLLRVGGIMIINDTQIDYINGFVTMYLNSGEYEEIKVLDSKEYKHRFISKIK